MYREKINEMIAVLNSVILGKEEVIKEVVTVLLSGGHILLEDAPGVGKTTLALALSRVMDIESKRVQFTPDVMPSELTGFSIYRKDIEKFVYREGAVFCNLLLADELNRTSPKTQSALLEVMEEKQVSVEGVTRKLPSPFFVIATQNPYGTGVQELPLPQMDRFMASMSLGYPGFESEMEIAAQASFDRRVDNVQPVINSEIIFGIMKETERIYIDKKICEYIVKLVRATRDNEYIEMGASPRGTIALVKLCKTSAWLKGKSFVTPNDVDEQYFYAIKHRILLNSKSRFENISRTEVLYDIMNNVKKPLPSR
ncbi:MAG: MoxR family ATPase [Clostridia bacterium]|nr:MoxR family ATPase [Clostridia bacterium]